MLLKIVLAINITFVKVFSRETMLTIFIDIEVDRNGIKRSIEVWYVLEFRFMWYVKLTSIS